jgi:hypothetical protein
MEMNKVVYIKTEKFSAENMWQQTQFNEKIGKYGKSKFTVTGGYWCTN